MADGSVSFAALSERFLQFGPSAVDVGLYGAEGEVEDLGDFLVGSVLDMSQENAGAILRSQAPDRLFDGRPELAGLNFLQRVFSAILDLKRGRVDSLPGGRVRSTLDRAGVQAPAPQVIDGGVVGDLENPRGKLEFGAVTLDGVQRFDECFLGEIFGQLAVPHHPVNEREDGALVPAHQLAVGELLAVAYR